MAWSLGPVTNNYAQPIAVEVFTAAGATVDYSAQPISGGNINIVVPLRGTLTFVDAGPAPGSPPNALNAYFLDTSWAFRYDQTTKIQVTIAADGTPTLVQL